MTQSLTAVRVEPSPRWVRGFLNPNSRPKLEANVGARSQAYAAPAVDSKRVLVVYGLKRTPTYFFPRADVQLALTAGRQQDGRQFWNAPGRPDFAFSLVEPAAPELHEHVAVDWAKIDAWYEEDEEVFVHPRDPHHRVDVLDSSRHVRIVIDGQVMADSHRPRLLFETGLRTRYYLPKLDMRMDLLEPTQTHTACPYKGNAVYWSARVNGQVYEDVVWSYPFPTPECPKIQNLLSFYDEKVDVYVDGEPQPR